MQFKKGKHRRKCRGCAKFMPRTIHRSRRYCDRCESTPVRGRKKTAVLHCVCGKLIPFTERRKKYCGDICASDGSNRIQRNSSLYYAYLLGLDLQKIPPDLLELKKAQIKLIRKVRGHGNTQNNDRETDQGRR